MRNIIFSKRLVSVSPFKSNTHKKNFSSLPLGILHPGNFDVSLNNLQDNEGARKKVPFIDHYLYWRIRNEGLEEELDPVKGRLAGEDTKVKKHAAVAVLDLISVSKEDRHHSSNEWENMVLTIGFIDPKQIHLLITIS